MDSQESIAGDPLLAALKHSGMANSPAALGDPKPASSPPLAAAATGTSPSALLGGSFFTPPPSPASLAGGSRGSQGLGPVGREPGAAAAGSGSMGAVMAGEPVAAQLMDAAEQLQAVVARAQEEDEEVSEQHGKQISPALQPAPGPFLLCYGGWYCATDPRSGLLPSK